MKKYKVVIVGGGSTWTPGLLKSLCEKKNEFPMEELRMYDINAERQAENLQRSCLRRNTRI